MTVAVAAPASFARAASTAAPIIRVEGLRKQFAVRRPIVEVLRHPRGSQRKVALDGVSLEVREGEILGLLGPNGAGKTTLVKILSTLVTPDAGRVEVGGFDVVRQAAAVRRVLAPVTPDERSLDWRLSARENLRFFGALHGLRGPELARRIEQVLGDVELQGTAGALVGTFSSGMKQRLLIGRALLSRPKVLLLDEPTRSLDPLAARSFRAFLRRDVAGRAGCTVLLATHDTEEALELSDRIAVLGRGRILACGTPGEVEHRFVEARHRARVRDGGQARLARAAERLGLVVTIGETLDEDGCVVADLAAHDGGAVDPVGLLAALVEAGVPVARFERARPSLADLMDRVLAATEGTHA